MHVSVAGMAAAARGVSKGMCARSLATGACVAKLLSIVQ